MNVYRVAVVGASGYTGIELVRYLLGHPGFDLVAAVSDTHAGQKMSELYPTMIGRTNMVFSSMSQLAALKDLDLAFLAVPHTAALALAPDLLSRGVNVIDLSADFRLNDAQVYEQWYQHRHTAPELLSEAIYGLPELNRCKLLDAHQQQLYTRQPMLVASPGCYPTASALACAPALAAGVLDSNQPIIVNAISGASGMGRKATEASLFMTVNENLTAYGVATHRHTPEIEQVFSQEAGYPVTVQFTPHLAPLTRGMVSTATMFALPGVTQVVIDAVYATAYADEPFVQLLSGGQMPRSDSVMGTNQAQVGVVMDTRTGLLIASCAIDNLGKGASAQALQSANVIFDFPETLGLEPTSGVV